MYTTKIEPSEKRTVMVWIHGGGFYLGDASFYGPDYIVQKDVILVTLNYRLGSLGTLFQYVFLIYHSHSTFLSSFFQGINILQDLYFLYFKSYIIAH